MIRLCLAAAIALLVGCFDHRAIIAKTTLVDESGMFDDRALSAALSARFAGANSSIAGIRSLVESLNGECGPGRIEMDENIYCSVPETGGFCVGSRIRLTAIVREGKIVEIEAKSFYNGC